jgi:hypothetical protein
VGPESTIARWVRLDNWKKCRSDFVYTISKIEKRLEIKVPKLVPN